MKPHDVANLYDGARVAALLREVADMIERPIDLRSRVFLVNSTGAPAITLEHIGIEMVEDGNRLSTTRLKLTITEKSQWPS